MFGCHHWVNGHAAAAAKLLQSCSTLCGPIDGRLPSLRFSRQEYWSGLPFLSSMHESKKWNWSRSVVSNSLRFCGLHPIRLLHPWDFPGKSTGVGCHFLLHNEHGLSKLQAWWWTGRSGVLRPRGSQRVRDNWETELNWISKNLSVTLFYSLCHRNFKWYRHLCRYRFIRMQRMIYLFIIYLLIILTMCI